MRMTYRACACRAPRGMLWQPRSMNIDACRSAWGVPHGVVNGVVKPMIIHD
jgi:hypothetical protein